MKDVIGKWCIVETMHYNEETEKLEWAKVSDLMAKGDADPETAMLLDTEVYFEEDGNLVFLSPLPEDVSKEELDEALASGELILKDGKMITSHNQWKVEDGKIMTDTGMEGEVLGEKVGPWVELKEIDDNTIELMMFHLQKAD